MPEMTDHSTGELIPMFYRRSPELGELFAALAKAQAKFGAAEKSATNEHFKSPYATLESVMEATREGRAENGLAVMQMPGNFGTNVAVTTLLGHASGQWMESTVYVAPGKFDAQGVGSAITYLRRYSLMAVLGIAPEDDDGNAASVAPPATVSRPPPPRPNGNGGASKITPAVAPQSDRTDEGRAAFARVSAAIHAAEDEHACRRVFDELLDEWGAPFERDVETVRAVNAAAVDELKGRLFTRIKALRAGVAAK